MQRVTTRLNGNDVIFVQIFVDAASYLVDIIRIDALTIFVAHGEKFRQQHITSVSDLNGAMKSVKGKL
jgi:hypothetical protein